MSDILYLAWRYLTYHWLKTLVLVGSIAVILYLPIGLNIVTTRSAVQLRERAGTTPLLVGAVGSPLELVLRALYFSTDEPRSISVSQIKRVTDSGLAQAIPVYCRFRTRFGPIVGTELDYFDFRRLRISRGRQIAMLGECVIGGKLAQRGEFQVGDSILSSGEDLFNLAGVYPLKMKIVGILEQNDSPDDDAVFVDLKTCWIIEGLGHGHQDLARPDAAESVLRRDGNTVVANASVMQFNEITPGNAASFHFHGDTSEFPVTAIIAVPHDSKANAMLQGRFVGPEQTIQIVRPNEVMDELLGTVFTVGRYVTIAVLIVGASTVATMALVFALSLQLRRGEIQTLAKIGVSRRRVFAIVCSEIVTVLCLGTVVASILALATVWLASHASRQIIDFI